MQHHGLLGQDDQQECRKRSNAPSHQMWPTVFPTMVQSLSSGFLRDQLI
jgi:hypothetical protein